VTKAAGGTKERGVESRVGRIAPIIPTKGHTKINNTLKKIKSNGYTKNSISDQKTHSEN